MFLQISLNFTDIDEKCLGIVTELFLIYLMFWLFDKNLIEKI